MLGMVFGNLALSPLYVLNSLFFGQAGLFPSPQNVYGSVGLIIYAFIAIITFKYFFLVLRGMRGGEGGIFILRSFIAKSHISSKKFIAFAGSILVLGAGLFIGEGMLTPALGFSSAVEGWRISSPGFSSVLPVAILLLTAFYFLQGEGMKILRLFFNPIMTLWLTGLGFFGFLSIRQNPEILNSLDPAYIFIFLSQASFQQFLSVISVLVLVVIGGEVLFANMHYSRKKYVFLLWFGFVCPMLVLNYLGQAAHLLGGGIIVHDNIFFSMLPGYAQAAMAFLAVGVAAIASEAWISAAFRLVFQAIALQLFPRMKIRTLRAIPGGWIYIPGINWFFYLGSLGTLMYFQTSNGIVSVYGIASAVFMFITTFAVFIVASGRWKWGFFRTFVIILPLVFVDGLLLVSVLPKIIGGGYIALDIALLFFMVMKIWEWGNGHMKYAVESYRSITMKELVHKKVANETSLASSVIVMLPKPVYTLNDYIPALEQIFIDRNGLLPKNIIFLTVLHHSKPYMFNARYQIIPFYKDHEKGQIASVCMNFGSLETPDVKKQLLGLARHRLLTISDHPDSWLVHVLEEHFVPSKSLNPLTSFAIRMYESLEKSSEPLAQYYGLGNVSGLSSAFLPMKIHP